MARANVQRSKSDFVCFVYFVVQKLISAFSFQFSAFEYCSPVPRNKASWIRRRSVRLTVV